jgi:hypothetical protein
MLGARIVIAYDLVILFAPSYSFVNREWASEISSMRKEKKHAFTEVEKIEKNLT